MLTIGGNVCVGVCEGGAFLHTAHHSPLSFGHSNRNEVPPPCGLDVQFLSVKQ